MSETILVSICFGIKTSPHELTGRQVFLVWVFGVQWAAFCVAESITGLQPVCMTHPVLTQQPLKSNPKFSPKYQPAISLMQWEQYLILVLLICWPYLCGGAQFQFIQFVLNQDHPSALDIIWTSLCRRLACIPLCLSRTGLALTFKSPWERAAAAEQQQQIDLNQFCSIWL